MEWSGVEWSGVEWSGVEWSGVERTRFSAVVSPDKVEHSRNNNNFNLLFSYSKL